MTYQYYQQFSQLFRYKDHPTNDDRALPLIIGDTHTTEVIKRILTASKHTSVAWH